MRILTTLLSIALIAGAGLALQDDSATEAEKAEAAKKAIIAEQLPSYPLDTCVITGKALDSMGGPIDLVHQGRLVRLCCKGCIKAVEKSPETVFEKIDAAVVKAQRPSYPLKNCVVMEDKAVDAMGKPIEYVHGTRLIRLCCEPCVEAVDKDPAKYLAKVDTALIAAQVKTYPLDTCVVLGGPLDGMGRPVDHLYGTRLVRFCCKGCIEPFRKEPAKYLAKIDAAAKGK